MASRTKKAAAKSDTITMSKKELVEKVKDFLDRNNACDGDWLNKVRTEILGEKLQLVEVKLHVPVEITLEMVNDGLTKETIANHIANAISDGDIDPDSYWIFDAENYIVQSFTVKK